MEKVIIDQGSLERFINKTSPGAYVSLTNIDFQALDNASVKPIGIYGSKERIADLLLEVGAIESHLFVVSSLQRNFSASFTTTQCGCTSCKQG